MFIDTAIGKIYARLESDYVPELITQETEPELMKFDTKEDQPSMLKATVPSLYEPTGSVDVSLDKFLSRPVKILSVAWAQGTNIDTSFDPWKLFLNHTSMKKRIDNYAYMRFDLKLKVVVNASPFYYGAALVSYRPLSNWNVAPHASSFITMAKSQRPHIWVYPQENLGGEITLPFLYHKEWLDVTSDTSVTDMGRANFYVVNQLNTVGSGTGNTIDVQIFAWAENIRICGATVKLALQGDEYQLDGPISKPASAIARATGLLAAIPSIAPYATATSIAAETIANIAALFGYTKIPTVANTTAVKNMPFRSFANSDIGDVMDKLSIDSKNELSINSSTIGDPLKDYALITNFLQHSSYLTKFTWTAAQAYETLLWNAYVSPKLSSFTALTQRKLIQGTPMWQISNMFENWRGDIIFDFKFICTKFHRGRVRIAWDPVGYIGASSNSYTEVNNIIIDISENTSVSVRVPYLQETAYLKVEDVYDNIQYDTTALDATALANGFYNGILAIFVMNEQSSPLTSADISVLVTVRGAENLEFANPKEISNQLSYFDAQSDFVKEDTDMALGEPSSVNPHINLIYMGETIKSFRELLQRTNYSDTTVITENVTDTAVAYMYCNRRPIFNGYDPNGIHTAVGLVSGTPKSYNYIKPSPYLLLAPCFAGERGSISWHLNVDGFEETTINISRSIHTLTIPEYDAQQSPLITDTVVASREVAPILDTNTGSLITHQYTNAGASAIVPMYTNLTMLETNPSYRVLGLTNVSQQDAVQFTWTNHEYKERASNQYMVHKYYNMGPDHSFVFFLNVPAMYYYNSYPVAS